MSDLCVHRGTALSLGWIQGDELACAYHGWRYAADGRCVAIPQKEDPSAVPAKARVPAFRAQERYGLIWAALEEPWWPLPEVPELENDAWAVTAAGPYRWQCDAARQVENFTGTSGGSPGLQAGEESGAARNAAVFCQSSLASWPRADRVPVPGLSR